uniref:Putative cation efflux protein/ zinc transporter n=1 Tax=Ixodes ricinus TaxID=34613 RepID=A0A090XD04_IXORI
MESDGCAKLYAALALSGLFFVAEIIASHVTHSLVLLIYSYQMLYNVLALVLLVISYHICQERTLKNTFGWARVEVARHPGEHAVPDGAVLRHRRWPPCRPSCTRRTRTPSRNYPIVCCSRFGIIGLSVDIVCYLVIGGSKSRRGCNLGIVSGTDVQFNFVVGGDSSSGDETPLPCQVHPDDVTPKQLEALLPQQAATIAHPVSGGWRECLLEAVRTCGGCLMVVGCACAVHFGSGVASPTTWIPCWRSSPWPSSSAPSLPEDVKNPGSFSCKTSRTTWISTRCSKKLLEKFPAILNVHEFHLWQSDQYSSHRNGAHCGRIPRRVHRHRGQSQPLLL